MEDLFRFHLEADIQKSEDASDDVRLIRGYASTADQDRQGESLLQKGLDISDFVNHGYFNYDHDNSIILGYPLQTCKVDSKGFWVEGHLLKGVPQADRIWELAKALKKSNAPRRIGFSVEGKVVERSGNKIVKAKIYNVAITTNPVNANCSWEAVVKSFNAPTVSKSLEAGYEVDPTKMEGGSVLRKESLEDSLHNLSYVVGNDKNKKILKEKLAVKKSLSTNELTLYLQIVHGWSQQKAYNFIENIK